MTKIISILLVFNSLVLTFSVYNLFSVNDMYSGFFESQNQEIPEVGQKAIVKMESLEENEIIDEFPKIISLFKGAISYINDTRSFVNESAEALLHYSILITFVAVLNFVGLFWVFHVKRI